MRCASPARSSAVTTGAADRQRRRRTLAPTLLRPGRGHGYLIVDLAANREPLPPAAEHGWWYQYYFATARGEMGYRRNTGDFNSLIWQLASPDWHFADETYELSAASFDNPDHVDIVVHNYRWRQSLAPGEPRYDDDERRLAARPAIAVPTITIASDFDGAARTAPPTATDTPAGTSIACSTASATTCPRRRLMLRPRRSPTSTDRREHDDDGQHSDRPHRAGDGVHLRTRGRHCHRTAAAGAHVVITGRTRDRGPGRRADRIRRRPSFSFRWTSPPVPMRSLIWRRRPPKA